MPDEKTVKVRVLVSVGHDGCWEADGGSSRQPGESLGIVSDQVFDGAHYWLTADLPVPIEPEVDADVEEDPHA